jgi:hypothetical protein
VRTRDIFVIALDVFCTLFHSDSSRWESFSFSFSCFVTSLKALMIKSVFGGFPFLLVNAELTPVASLCSTDDAPEQNDQDAKSEYGKVDMVICASG